MARAFDVHAGLIMRLSGDEIEVFVSSDTDGNPYRPGDREEFLDSGLYCETVIRSREVLLIPDALADPDWRENPDVKLGMISYLGMPIFFPDGSPFGTICVLDKKENSYSDLYVELLSQFKTVAESHLGLAVLNERLGTRNQELEAALAEVKELKEILPVCMKCMKVRDDEGYWSRLEAYLKERKNIAVSHSLCPECAAQWEQELDREWEDRE
jgi:GAF domain-containing protein